VALFPDLVAYPTFLISECLWAFLVLGGAVLAGRPGDQRPWRRILPAGVLLGAAALVRSNTVLYVVLWTVLALWTPERRWRALGRAFLVSLLAAAVVLPWTVRCSLVAGRLIIIDVTIEGSLRLGHQPGHRGGKKPMVNPPGVVIPPGRPVHELTRRQQQWALDEIRAHPGATVVRSGWKLARLLHPRGDLELLDSPMLPAPALWWLASTLATELFLLLLLVGLARSPPLRDHAPALAMLLAVLAAVLITFFAGRYRQPLLLFAPVLAATALRRELPLRRGRLALLLALHLLALVVATWLDWPQYLENLPRLLGR
jgi:hypothetical protein